MMLPADPTIFYSHLQEAIECVKEMESPKQLNVFVARALEHVLERSAQARKMTGNLMHDLVKRNVLTVDQYLIG